MSQRAIRGEQRLIEQRQALLLMDRASEKKGIRRKMKRAIGRESGAEILCKK